MNAEQFSEAMSIFCKILSAKATGDVLMYDGKIISAIEIKNDGGICMGESVFGNVYRKSGKKFTVLTNKEENNDSNDD